MDSNTLLQQYNDVGDDKTSVELEMLKKIIINIQTQKKSMLQQSKKHQTSTNFDEIDKLLEQLQSHI